MKRTWYKIIVVAVMAALIMPSQSLAANREDQADIIEISEEELKEYLPDNYPMVRGPVSGYMMLNKVKGESYLRAIFSASANQVASEVGIKKLVLERKDGLFWTAIDIRDVYAKDTISYSGGYKYLTPEEGKTYRLSGIYYAIIDGKEYTLYGSSDKIEF